MRVLDIVKGARVAHAHATLVGALPELADAVLNPAFLERVRDHESLRLEFSNGLPSVWCYSTPGLLEILRSAPGRCMEGEALTARDPLQMRALASAITPGRMPFLWMSQRVEWREETFHLVVWAATSHGDANVWRVLRGARGHMAYKATSWAPVGRDEMWCHHVPLSRNSGADQLLAAVSAIPHGSGVCAVRVGVGKRDQWIDMHSVRPTKARVDLLVALGHLRRCAVHPPSDVKRFFSWCKEVGKTLERREANTFHEAVAGIEATLFNGMVLYAPEEEEEDEDDATGSVWGACKVASAGDVALTAWLHASSSHATSTRFCLYEDCEEFGSATAVAAALIAARSSLAFAERIGHLLAPTVRTTNANGMRFWGGVKKKPMKKQRKKGRANAHMRGGT